MHENQIDSPKHFATQIYAAGVDLTALAISGSAGEDSLPTWQAVHGAVTPIMELDREEAEVLLGALSGGGVAAVSRAMLIAYRFVEERDGHMAAEDFLSLLRASP